MMRPALSPSAMAAYGWTRVDPRPWGKCSARWTHPKGWRLEHCGHPSALWPWALYNPAGELILTGAAGPLANPRFGTGWPTLATAAAYVARVS